MTSPTTVHRSRLVDFTHHCHIRRFGISIPIGIGPLFSLSPGDIDLIIRRTLQYSLLSGLLALTYFGLVVVLQGVFTAVTGQSSPVVLVLSTLAIAALFFPLRKRVQDFIDKRFFRQKYDAAKTLADFAATARDETDLDNDGALGGSGGR
jgi:hypothetical protein